MNKILTLILAAGVAACCRAPEPPAPTASEPVATPVRNAPKTTPIPIQPLDTVPAIPHTAPISTPIPATAPEETGTPTPVEPTQTPVPEPTP